MSINQLTQTAGEWLRGTGPLSDIVISSRVRLARNLAGFPYVNAANRRQKFEILDRCRERLTDGRLGDDVLWVDVAASSDLDRQLLVERHLISRQHALDSKTDKSAKTDDQESGLASPAPRSVAVGAGETFAVMVNEEDHLRMQVMRSGMQLAEAFRQIDHIDDILESHLDFAYSQRWGYLTACPTNIGTGIRISVMLHLPALKLTGEIEKVRRAARDMHLAIRGLFGEGSEALGDLYQISNQTTLGRNEREILADFESSIVPQIVGYEQQARQALIRQRPAQLDDKIHRAWAILTHARVINTEEVLGLLSHLRLGVNLGRIDCVGIRAINELFLVTQPAHLQILTGCDPEPAARRQARADLIRRRLNTK